MLQQIKLFLYLFLFLLLNPATLIVVFLFLKKVREYKASSYYRMTGLRYFSMRGDTGRYGEYLTYCSLKDFEAAGARFLFNLYVPKENGGTTEIDLLMIDKNGLFVFESKNYSGWIFGSEGQKNWYQTLPAGRGKSHKESFYNPIMQNRSHIKHLQLFLGRPILCRSVIVFSERCVLKDIQISSDDVIVTNRNNLAASIFALHNETAASALSASEMEEIFEMLYPLTQTTNETRIRHIADIQSHTVFKAAVPADYSAATEEPEAVAASDSEPGSFKCPRCGSALILRTATKGTYAGKQFYGCSGYPKCKYIRNTDNIPPL